LATSFGLLWYCLPRRGKLYRFANTDGAIHGVVFCSGIALSFTIVLSNLINLFGSSVATP
jgi:hypothetical protein